MKQNIQQQRQISRILQQHGYQVRTGDTGRILEALGSQTLKTGRVLSIAVSQGVPKAIVRRPRAVVREQALAHLATSLPSLVGDAERTRMRDAMGVFLERALTRHESKTCGVANTRAGNRLIEILQKSPTMYGLGDDLAFNPQEDLSLELCECWVQEARAGLRRVLMEHADMLVHQLPDDCIDYLDTFKAVVDAFSEVEPFIVAGGRESGPLFLAYKDCLSIEVETFFVRHVPNGQQFYEKVQPRKAA